MNVNFTAREIEIAKKILEHLHELDGGQEHPITVQAAIGGMNVCGSAEFRDLIGKMDSAGWLVVVPTQFRGQMISISDGGEQARLKMQS